MTDRHIHIISFNVPYPPNYGGVIDIFYKIKSLSTLGIKIHLHCFQYGRKDQEILNKYCTCVHYYPRKKFYELSKIKTPYIVATRKSDDLLNVLTQDTHPILFEGLHTCYYLSHPALSNRKKIVWMHNVEWDYYKHLSKAARNLFSKIYFFTESRKLKNFEKELNKADIICAIGKNDFDYLKKKYPQVYYMPTFHLNETVCSKKGKGTYALYHGNLNVEENNKAAIFLCQKVFKELDIPFVIAGNAPLESLKKVVDGIEGIELIANPSKDELEILIQNAHVNVLMTFQATGIKHKLINALYQGRFCITNTKLIQKTGLEELCINEDNPLIMRKKIIALFSKSFTQTDIDKRKEILYLDFSNLSTAKNLIKLIF